MSIAEDHMISTRRARRQREERDYRIAFWIAFPFFLLLAALSRLDPRRLWTTTETARPRRSVFRQAWVDAQSSLPFAFMN
jgi:hypothetical protein